MKHAGKLRLTLPSPTEVVMTRVFAAPASLVYQCCTRPELFRRWFGPHGYQVTECEMDVRVGGAYRWVVRAPDGSEMTLAGVHLELVPDRRIVLSERKEGCEEQGDAEVTSTWELVERDGETTLTMTVRFPSAEIRDAVVRSGMDGGVAQGYDRLEELLREL